MESQVRRQIPSFNSPSSVPYQFFPLGECEGMGMMKQATLSERTEMPLNLFSDSHDLGNRGLNGTAGECRQNRPGAGHWDLGSWDWDSHCFVATPTSEATTGDTQPNNKINKFQILENGGRPIYNGFGLNVGDAEELTVSQASDIPRKRLFGEEQSPAPSARASSCVEEEPSSDTAACLTLKLGGDAYSLVDGASGAQNGKRYRSSSPGSGQQYPRCQVDDCTVDLTTAKDYHRRHKVCEMHAKAVKAPVGRLMQRFCQQCSRFHLLQEFDDGKRSCRRRLAGHNRRRRKNQPDIGSSSGYLLPEDEHLRTAAVLGLVNLLYQLQATRSSSQSNGVVTDADWLLRLLRKASSGYEEPGGNPATVSGSTSQTMEQGQLNVKPPSESVANAQGLLAILSSMSPEVLALLLNNSFKIQRTGDLQKEHISARPHLQNGVCLDSFQGTGTVAVQTGLTEKIAEQSNLSCALSRLSSLLPTEKLNSSNSLQPSLKNTAPQISPIIVGSVAETLVPHTQKFFPVSTEDRSCTRSRLLEMNRINHDPNRVVDGPSTITFLERDERALNKSGSFNPQGLIDLQKLPPEHLSENSESGSDKSPCSSNEDVQDLTERIVFKLFDRNPGEIPQALRSQILEWLSHSPLNMESYIRPGCVVVTVFLSMLAHAWEELIKDLQFSLKRLLLAADDGFWCKGRIFVQIGWANALIVDGEIYINKPLVPSSLPHLVSVRPLAIVAGEETKLILKGHNLSSSETNIICAYEGKYQKVPSLQQTQLEGLYSETEGCPQELSFSFCVGALNTLGRCFIEVERFAVAGNFIPVIVADKQICQEIQTLESEIERAAICSGELFPGEMSSTAQAKVEAEVRNVIHELGWIFQRDSLQKSSLRQEKVARLQCSSTRFKNLLIYAVERDWCAVLKKLLDVFFATLLGPLVNAHSTLMEVRLLHRAVRRKCRPIVDMLVAYDISFQDHNGVGETRPSTIFRPDVVGPGGLTPLHIAASMEGAEQMVDALTNDPAQVGLHAWSEAQDSSGQTPCAYAQARGHQSYLQLVEEKCTKLNASAGVIIDIPRQLYMEGVEGGAGPQINQSTPSVGVTIKADSEENVIQSDEESHHVELPVWKNSQFSKGIPEMRLSAFPSACKICEDSVSRRLINRMSGLRGPVFRPFVLSLVAIATVCVCVCLLLKGPPQVLFVTSPFTWESVGWGYM